MAIRLPTHLHRAQSGILHFRIAAPPDLQQHFSIREIYRSLRTANVRDATLAAQLFQAPPSGFFFIFATNLCPTRKTPPPARLTALMWDLRWNSTLTTSSRLKGS